MEPLHFWKASTCVVTATGTVKSLQKAEWSRGSVCPMGLQKCLKEGGGGSPPPPWHHWDSEYFRIKSQVLCPENSGAGFLEILCSTWGGKLTAFICPRAAHSCWEWRHFPLERQRQRSFPILWTSGHTEIAGDTNKNLQRYFIHEILN